MPNNIARAAATIAHRDGIVTARRAGFLLGLAAAIPGIDIVRAGPFRLWHVLVVCALLYVIHRIGKERLLSYRPGLLDLLSLGFVIFLSTLEYISSIELSFEGSYGFTLAPLFYYLAFLTARLALRCAGEGKAFLSPFVTFAIPSALIAVGQLISTEFGYLTTAIASGEGLDRRLSGEGLVRAAGLFGHWTGAGFYFAAMTAASIVLILLTSSSGGRNPGAIVALVASLVGSLSTLTYSVIATAGVLVMVLLLKSKRKMPAFLVLAASGVGGLLFADELSSRAAEQATGGTSSGLPEWVPSTIRYRFVIWERQTIPAIEERPWRGWGAAVFTDSSIERTVPGSLLWSSAESQWFFLAVSFGVIGVAWLVLMLAAAWRLVRSASPSTAGASVVIEVLLAMAIISSFTVPVFTNRGFPLPFWILVGFAAAMGDIDRRSRLHPLTKAQN